MQESSVILLDRSGEERLDEVVLTNKNLVLVNTASQGLFKRTRYLKRCPLERIASPNGVPQAIASKHKNDYRLQVVFDDETIALRFPANPKRTAERWAEGIRNAALGNLSRIRTEDVLPPEVADLVDGAKGIFGAVFAGGKKQANTPETSKRPARITKKCVGCHAPLTGRAGETVTCAYCDTKQTL